MGDIHESNRAKIETYLDNSTVSFFRKVYDKHNTTFFNGTALGVVSLGSGIPPSGEGAYSGYFVFRTENGNALIIKTDGPYRFFNTTFMRKMENERGHSINYIRMPKKFKPCWAMDFREREKSIQTLLDPSRKISIGKKKKEYLFELAKKIKEYEFRTLEKYCIQNTEKDNAEEIKKIKKTFKNAINCALPISNVPIVPAVINYYESEYCKKSLGDEHLILEKDTWPFKDKRKELPEEIILPLSSLDKSVLEKICKQKNNDIPFTVELILNENKTDCQICRVSSRFLEKPLFEKTPDFLIKKTASKT